jgi:hypothetical protein
MKKLLFIAFLLSTVGCRAAMAQSGSGAVTKLTAGNLAGLFTTNVATGSSAPALTFAFATGQTADQIIGTCNGATTISLCSLTPADIPNAIPVSKITFGNCSSSTSPASCGSAAAGSIALPTNAVSSSIVVNTTALTANSQILVTTDDTLGTKLGITCNSTIATLVGGLTISSRTAGTSFTIANNVAIVANPLCVSYLIIN